MTESEWDCQFVFDFLFFFICPRRSTSRAYLAAHRRGTRRALNTRSDLHLGVRWVQSLSYRDRRRERKKKIQRKISPLKGCWSQGILWLARVCLAALSLCKAASLSWLRGAATTEPISPQRAKTTLQEWDNYLHSGCLTSFFIAQAVQTICCLSRTAWSGYLSGQPRGYG